MATEKIINSAVTNDNIATPDTVLDNSGTLGSGDTSLTVLTLPANVSAAQFRVRIDDEIMIVTAIGGAGDKTWTVTRGAEGTSAASHVDASNVYLVQTAGGLGQWLTDQVATTLIVPSTTSPAQTAEGSVVWDSDDDVLTIGDGASRKTFLSAASSIQQGTFASLPAAGKAGRIYICTDSLYWFLDTGSAWSAYYGWTPVTVPPSTGWTWDNQGSSTITTTGGYQYFFGARTGSVHLALQYRTAPATPYTVTFCFLYDILGAPPGASGTAANSGLEVGFRDAGGKLVTFGHRIDANSTSSIPTQKWTNSTTVTALYTSYGAVVNLIGVHRQPLWLQISDNGTNLIFRWSIDGFTWLQFDSRARGDFLTTGPNAYFYGAYVNGSSSQIALISLKET